MIGGWESSRFGAVLLWLALGGVPVAQAAWQPRQATSRQPSGLRVSLQPAAVLDGEFPRGILDSHTAYLYPADSGPNATVYDLSVPARPRRIGALDTSGVGVIDIVDRTLYGGVESELRIYDIADLEQPRLRGQVWLPYYYGGGTLEGSRIYYKVTRMSSSLVMVDVSNPDRPVEAGVCCGRPGLDLFTLVDGTTVYVSGSALYGASLERYDVSGSSGRLLAQVGDAVTPVAAFDGILFASDSAGLIRYDVSDPGTLRRLPDAAPPWAARFDRIYRGLAFVPATDGLEIYNVRRGADLSAPPVARLAIQGDIVALENNVLLLSERGLLAPTRLHVVQLLIYDAATTTFIPNASAPRT